jgi:hypothetical protein
MKKILKVILIIVGSLAVLLLAAYLYIRFMPEKSMSKQDASFTMSSTVLANEYNLNPEASDKKYIDRVIQVTGVISEISTDQNKATVFILRENSSATGVLCTLDEKSAKKAAKYKVGSPVTVKGSCTGMLFEVVLNKCVIVK